MRKLLFTILPIIYALDAVAFTIVCQDKADVGCTIEDSYTPTKVTTCTPLAALNKNTSPILLPHSMLDTCSEQFRKIKCDYRVEYIGNQSDLLVFCSDADNKPTVLYKSNAVSDNTFTMSYQQKQCIGSSGTWKSNNCSCPSDTTLISKECICQSGNTKYKINNSCHEEGCFLTGGTIGSEGECNCVAPHTEQDSNNHWCKCKDGYKFRDPTRRLEGCVSIKDNTIKISGTVKDNSETLPSATVSWYDEEGEMRGTTTDQNGWFDAVVPNTAYVTFSFTGYIPNTFAATDLKQNQSIILYQSDIELDEVTITPESGTDATTPSANPSITNNGECEKSGGEWDTENNVCICNKADESKHLHPDPVTVPGEHNSNSTYSICRCANGYKRQNGQYTDKCVDANETETKEVLDTEAMRQQAEDAYQAARDHEQSWANKGLTAATTLATGEGAMAATQAYFEQRADADAEADMRAYLATFKCEYGGGKTFNAGNEEIYLPGGNELLEYYSEYKTLADNIKQTKAALGLRSGIESEVLYDRAQSGLYQYANAERTSGGEISLSRALLNPEGVDAEKWNAQKAQTAQNLKTGTTTAIVGAAAGVVGNYFINRDYKPQEIKQEFKTIFHRLENEYGQIFIPETVEEPEEPVIEEIPTEVFEAMQEQLSAENTFEKGKLTLSGDGEQALKSMVRNIAILLSNPKYAKAILQIDVEAHTDRLGLTPTTKKNLTVKNNQELSQKRADTIMSYLIDEFAKSGISNRIRQGSTIGKGEDDCNDSFGKPLTGDQPTCRKLILKIKDVATY